MISLLESQRGAALKLGLTFSAGLDEGQQPHLAPAMTSWQGIGKEPVQHGASHLVKLRAKRLQYAPALATASTRIPPTLSS